EEPTMSRRVSRSILETEPVNGSPPPPPAAGGGGPPTAPAPPRAAPRRPAVRPRPRPTTRSPRRTRARPRPSRQAGYRAIRSRRCDDEGGDVMTLRRAAVLACLAAACVLLGAHGALGQSASPQVVELRIDGVVDPFVADHVEGGIADAADAGAAAVLLTLDTPGGGDFALRAHHA